MKTIRKASAAVLLTFAMAGLLGVPAPSEAQGICFKCETRWVLIFRVCIGCLPTGGSGRRSCVEIPTAACCATFGGCNTLI